MKFYFLFIFLLFSIYDSHSQIDFGIKLGLNSTQIKSDSISFSSSSEELQIVLEDIEYGIHFGIYTRFKILSFFIEPSLLFNSVTANFRLDQFTNNSIVSSIKKESYKNIDLPLLFGVKSGFINLHFGPIAHFQIQSTSELFEIDSYEQNFNAATFGYQGGIGFSFWKIGIELNYENNFSRFGNHIIINGTRFNFDDKPSRIIGTVRYSF